MQKNKCTYIEMVQLELRKKIRKELKLILKLYKYIQDSLLGAVGHKGEETDPGLTDFSEKTRCTRK